MAYSYQSVVSDGTLTNLLITIEYTRRSEVNVYFDDLHTTAWAWVGASEKQITFTTPVPTGTVVKVRRITNLNATHHVFSTGAQFKAKNMDENFRQVLNAAQEVFESGIPAGPPVISDDLNIQGYRIKNVAAGTASMDAVNKLQLDTAIATATGTATEAVTGSNRGAGHGVFYAKTGNLMEFKTLVAGAGATLSSTADTVTIGTTPDTTAGESIGTGVAIYSGKMSDTLKFRSLKAGAGITVSESGGDVTIAASATSAVSVVSVKDAPYNAVGNGSTNDTAAIQACINAVASAGGGKVYLPKGIYRTGKLTIPSNIWLVGEGRSNTTLKLLDGANTDLLYSTNADALWGSTTPSQGVQNIGLFDLTVDGNRANNTVAGSGIAFYGEEFTFNNLTVTQCRDHGIRTEWYQGDSVFGMEGKFTNIVIDTVGKDGWACNGPHDSYFSNVIIADASRNVANTYNGLTVGPNMTGRFIGVHVWNRYITGNDRHGWAVKLEFAGGVGGGCEFIGCHFEGAWHGNVGVFSKNNVFDDSNRYYAAWNGVNIYLGNTAAGNVIRGYLDAPGAGRPACKGVWLGANPGDYVSNNFIEVVANAQEAGAVDFGSTDGFNIVNVTGWSAGGGLLYLGTPHITDRVDMHVSSAIPAHFTNVAASGQSSDTASNLGTGVGVFSSKVGSDFQFRAVKGGTGISATQSGNDVLLTSTTSGSNVGAGTGLYYGASGANLQFKSIAAGANVTVSDSGTTLTIGAAGPKYYTTAPAVNGTSSYTWTFPAAFASNPMISCQIVYSGAGANITSPIIVQTLSTTSVTIYNPNTYQVYVGILALAVT